jgi:hypothetical protein
VLTEADIEAIKSVVAATPNIDHRILSIAMISRSEVEVTTGELPDPEAGSGNSIVVQKKDGQWFARIETIGEWIA